MSRRIPGRRAARRTEPTAVAGDRGPVLALGLLAVTLCLVTLAGVVPTRVARSIAPVREPGEATTQLVCPGGGAGARLLVGDLAGTGGAIEVNGTEAELKSETAFAAPAGTGSPEVRAAGALADTVTAAVVGAGAGVGCAQPRATWWFSGAGASATHRSTLVLVNPRDGVATADVSVFGPDGPVTAPELRGVAIPAGKAVTFSLASLAPSAGDVSLRVRTARGLVVAGVLDRPSSGADAPQEWIPAQRAPAMRSWVAAVPQGPGKPALVVTNPGETATVARIKVGGPRGRFVPEKLPEQRIPPGATRTFPLPASVTQEASSVEIDADAKVLASVRTADDTDNVHAPAQEEIRGSAGVPVPARGTRTLVLSATAAAVEVSVSYQAGSGERTRKLELTEQSTKAFQVPAGVSVVVIESDGGVVGAVVVESDSGRTVLPLQPPGLRAGALGVRPAG